MTTKRQGLIFLLFLLAFSFGLSSFASAEEPAPGLLLMTANDDANTAMRLVERARQTLQGDVNREKVQLAISLYVEAGQLFEKAETLYTKAGTEHGVSQEDIDGAKKAKEGCVQSISDLKKRFGGGSKSLYKGEPPKEEKSSGVLVSGV